MRPSQVLDMHVDLLTRLDDGRFRIGLGMTCEGEMFARQRPKEGRPDRRRTDPVLVKEREEYAAWHLELLYAHAHASHTYRVTEDMVDLLDWAAAGLEPEDEWDRGLAPTGCGIVHFDKPIVLGGKVELNDEGKVVTGKDMLRATWMMWGPGPTFGDGRPRTMLWWFGHSRDFTEAAVDDLLGRRLERMGHPPWEVAQIMGGWSLLAWDQFPQGMTLGQKTLPMGEYGVALDADDGLLQYEAPNASQMLKRFMLDSAEHLWQTNDARVVHALWLLLDQTITDVRDDERLERSSKRRAVRKRIPPRVTTIALRRLEHRPSEGQALVEWQHRWIVRGHWRWQRCGPKFAEVKRIWINPHVKGPEGLPLRVSDKVNDLRR